MLQQRQEKWGATYVVLPICMNWKAFSSVLKDIMSGDWRRSSSIDRCVLQQALQREQQQKKSFLFVSPLSLFVKITCCNNKSSQSLGSKKDSRSHWRGRRWDESRREKEGSWGCGKKVKWYGMKPFFTRPLNLIFIAIAFCPFNVFLLPRHVTTLPKH